MQTSISNKTKQINGLRLRLVLQWFGTWQESEYEWIYFNRKKSLKIHKIVEYDLLCLCVCVFLVKQSHGSRQYTVDNDNQWA